MTTDEMLVLLHNLWETATKKIDNLEKDLKQYRSELDRMNERFGALEAEVHARMPRRPHLRTSNTDLAF